MTIKFKFLFTLFATLFFLFQTFPSFADDSLLTPNETAGLIGAGIGVAAVGAAWAISHHHDNNNNNVQPNPTPNPHKKTFLYVADRVNHVVYKFDDSGNFILKATLPLASGINIYDLAVGPDSSIYVAEIDTSNNSGNHQVQIFDSEFKNPPITWTNVNTPVGIAVDSQSNVYVASGADKTVTKLNKNGTIVATWGTDHGMVTPFHIAVDKADNVYISDFGITPKTVFKFNNNGESLSKVSAGLITNPAGVAVDADSNLYVADVLSNTTSVVSEFDSQLIDRWSYRGGIGGQFKAVNGIAVDANKNLFVVDYGNKKIQKIALDGTQSLVWTLPDSSATPYAIAAGLK